MQNVSACQLVEITGYLIFMTRRPAIEHHGWLREALQAGLDGVDTLRLVPFRIVDTLAGRGSRAEDLDWLRKRIIARGEQASPAEMGRARQLRRLRETIIADTGQTRACTSCADGYPLPHGQWRGGHCCGGSTRELYSEHEIAALRAAGTGLADLRPPRSILAGCIFRGPGGCSIPAAHRPNICVSYRCPDLSRELMQRGILDHIEELSSRLDLEFETFALLREQRLNDELLIGK